MGRWGQGTQRQGRRWKICRRSYANRLGYGSKFAFVPPPSDGYNYDAYPPDLPRPIGDQPPTHAADPRKRCENCYELEHMHQYCPLRVDPSQPVRAQPRPAGSFTAPDQRPPAAHSYSQANIIAVVEVTDTDYYDYGDYSGDGDYGDYGDNADYCYESQQVPPQTQWQSQQQLLYCNYAQPPPPPPPLTRACNGYYAQPQRPPPPLQQPPTCYGSYVQQQHLPPAQQQQPSIYGYNPQQQPPQPPPPRLQQHPPDHVQPSSLSHAPGPSPPLQPELNLLMAPSAPQSEPELEPILMG